MIDASLVKFDLQKVKTLINQREYPTNDTFNEAIETTIRVLNAYFSGTTLIKHLMNDLKNLKNGKGNYEDEIKERKNALMDVIGQMNKYAYEVNSPYVIDAVNIALDDYHASNKSVQDATNKALAESLKNAEKTYESLAKTDSELERLKTESQKFAEIIQQRELFSNKRDFRSQANSSKAIAFILFSFATFGIICFVFFLKDLLNIQNEIYILAENIRIKADVFNSNAKTLKWDNDSVNKLIYIEIAKRIGTRLLMYSLSIYLIAILVKNFSAQMHNYITNSSIANALESMTSLIGTTKTKAGNDAMLTQITQAIFASQKSGYLGKDSDVSSPNLIANVIEAAKSNK